GIPDYCDILLMPFTGKVEWDNQKYRSPFSHKNEKAAPGYYEVLLDKHKIKAQLTTSYRSGMHQYEFPTGEKTGNVLIDLTHRDEVLDAWIEKLSDHEIRGMRRSKSWAQDQYVFFYAKFEQPIKDFVILDDGKESRSAKANGKNLKAFVSFGLPSQHQKIKIGISAVSAEGAKANLEDEIRDWDFQALKLKAQKAWNKELSAIEVKGGTHNQQVAFYTALYHCMLAPNIFQDVDRQYRGTDRNIHKAEGFTNYSVFSLWDTYRAFHPLMNIINMKRTTDWLHTFLAQHKNGGMLPVWELAGNETFCMIGYHSVPVILDAYKKGLMRGKKKELLEAMVAYADSDRFGLDHYRKYGFISNEKEHESVSKTLEYAYDDWCIAEFARITGNHEIYKRFNERAQYYQNLFDASSKNMRGKIQAHWYHPFDPAEINNFFTEANSWQYSFAVPHDVDHLIKLHGGKTAFAKKLDELFTTTAQTTGREQADVTGLIGQYAHGNEPSHHKAYLFNYAGIPWRTQEIINQINKSFYLNNPGGLIGNEDCGQMSAWFVFSAMGFYPVCPGDGQYILGTPMFDEVKLHLENGKTFLISSKRNKPGDFYVASTRLNGKNHTKSFISYEDVSNGGVLNFTLNNKRSNNWGTKENDHPTSPLQGERITAVPHFLNQSVKFRDSTQVALSALDETADIFYRIRNADFKKYTHPFSVSGSVTVEAYAQKNDKKSKTVDQYFHLIPNNYQIDVLSDVHPMYTAGGPDALVDGLQGTINWRTGEWQSYFDDDFLAFIDLRSVKDLNFLGIHVLQDVSPWIIYPREVIFYISSDGENFELGGRAGHSEATTIENKNTMILGLELKKKARFILVHAKNGGKLPEWHESRGNGSHLFIDEIIIK
nr:glycoside hydrolase family 92 protein [Flavisolibacter sp.]